jgi:gliding motility-associated-like protein
MIAPAIAQQPVFDWAKAFTATGYYARDNSNGRTVAVDKQGNVYSAGLFQHEVDFDPGPGVYALSPDNYFETGIYISKLDANGNFVWAVRLPVLVEWGAIELKTDENGNVYLVSSISDTADVDPGPGVYMMSQTGFKDALIIKFDTNGDFIWAKQFGGPGDTGAECTGVEIDNKGNVIVCGFFNNTVDFDPGPGVYNLTSTAHFQSFIAKLTSSGDLIWALQFGNSPVVYDNSEINDVKCDKNGDIYTTGIFKGTCDFDPGASVYELKGVSLMDQFISKLDANGNFVWAKQVSNTSNDYYQYIVPHGIDIDAGGNVITTGYFIGEFDFDPGEGNYIVSNIQTGIGEAFLLKLTGNGDFTWVKKVNSPEGCSGNDLVIDNNDNIYMCGDFSKTSDFDPGQAVYKITGCGDYFPALMKVDAGGNFVYATGFSQPDDGDCLLRRMVTDAAENIYITGYVAGTFDFDPGPNKYLVTSSADESPYVLKLGRCPNPTTAELHVNACSSYTLNDETFDTSGIYRRVIPNSYGCDSVITLYLTINKQYKQQTVSICEGQSFYAGGAYQTSAGKYIDTLQTTQGCDSIVETQLTVHLKPKPDLGADRNLCNNSEAFITPGNFKSYLWQDLSIQNNFKIDTAGMYWVKVTDEFNCAASDTLYVNSVLPSPVNFLKATDSICDNETLLVTSLNSYRAYYWSNGAVSKEITVQQPGAYSLTVTDFNHCEGSDTISIFQKQCNHGVYIPSAFSPNHDGKNDIFKPQIFGNVVKYRFIIYNRWGKIVFETNDVHRGWDGTYNSLPQTIGSFVWICNFQLQGEKEEIRKGSMVLLR